MNNGIKIKKYIEKKDTNDVLVINEFLKYDGADIDTKYIPNFLSLIEDAILEPVDFNYNTWYGFDEFEVKTYLKFTFELNQKINNILKYYIIIKLSENYTTLLYASKVLTYITEILKETNFLNKDNIESFRESIKFWNVSKKSNVGMIKEFLKFYSFKNGEEYYQILDKISTPQKTPRTIPCYKSIITFDYIIQDFISNVSIEQKNRFYPILIWWELTKIIPMRPIELGILKKDCLFIRDGMHYIKIERRKKKKGRVNYKTIKVLTEIKITPELYSFIDYYVQFTSKISTGEFLFSNSVYKLTNSKTYKESEIDFIGMATLRELLLSFFNDIVHEKYGYEVIQKEDTSIEIHDSQIEKIQLGDTRHIAFCSMMLQGFNPLTIAQIGGHYTLTEQLGYCNHLDSFVQSYTFVMTKSLRNKINQKMSKAMPANYTISKQKIVERVLLKDDFFNFRKVKGGRCKSENFPYECQDTHLFCDFFIPDETLTPEILNQELSNIDSEIDLKIKYIKSLSVNLIGFKAATMIEQQLKTNTNSLNALMKQKAMLESYKLNIMEDKEKNE